MNLKVYRCCYARFLAIGVPTFDQGTIFKFMNDNIFNKISSLNPDSYFKNTTVPFDWLVDHAYVFMIGA